MSVVFDRPYKFVPPDHGNIWPWFIQRLRLYDRYLKNSEGIVDYELRGLDRFKASLDQGHGILLAPNHSRYCDPLVLGWPARAAQTNVFAMASWHLFNEGSFNEFAIRKMGAFSLCREGTDRQSLETAIDVLATAARPLIVFPEGTTSRTNDHLIPLLEGVTFITRSAARRRARKSTGKVVAHPVAIKYLCLDPVEPWAQRQVDGLERRLGWRTYPNRSLLERSLAVVDALISLRELEFLGRTRTGSLDQRRHGLIEHLLQKCQSRLGLKISDLATPGDCVRQIRTEVAARFFADTTSSDEKQRVRSDVYLADTALQLLLFYPDCYLKPENITDSRIVEVIQRMQECFGGKFDGSIRLKAVIQFDDAIEVPAEKSPRRQEDPILVAIRQRLTSMIDNLSGEARTLKD